MTAPVALLYDLHGNLPALEAVLADARAQGASTWVLGGDYAAFGAWPAEVADRLHALSDDEDVRWIRGNWDRWLADELTGTPSPDRPDSDLVAGAARFALAALADDVVRRLGELDAQLTIEAPDGHATRCVHGSARSDMTSFLPTQADDDTQHADGVTEPRLVFGHTHLQFQRPGPRGITLLNPGSVGLPLDGDVRAAYALLHSEGAELRRVPYDHEGGAAALEAIGTPWAVEIAGRLRKGHA